MNEQDLLCFCKSHTECNRLKSHVPLSHYKKTLQKQYHRISQSQQEPQSFFSDGFNISALMQWDTYLVAASESWSLQQWKFPGGDKVGVLGRFSGYCTVK